MIITYMYWNNPTINLTFPSDQDPIEKSLHNGAHCLFYHPAITKSCIHYSQSLQDLCDWANNNIMSQGIDQFVNNSKNHYDIANLVKLNMWVSDIRYQGVVKPMNLYYDGSDRYGINNGESRLRALERIDTISTVSGFIGCRAEYADNFSGLESVTTFERFAELCHAVPGQRFLFTLTDPDAPYGIFWYEYDSGRTVAVTPSESYCVSALQNYLNQQPHTVFDPHWFDSLIAWHNYAE
jgi:hypothetical protein